MKMKALQKALTFRVLAVLSTAGITWGLTGNYNMGATVGVTTGVANTLIYIAHEKAWNKVGQNGKSK